MRNFLVAMLLALSLVGCSTASQESQIDTELREGSLPAAVPQSGPGEPQQGFDQEVTTDSVTL